MHPALSIVAFTTLSGLGYGLAAILGLGLFDPGAVATKVAWVAALGLISVGLGSSLLHLGNPQRAWRALSQWRSSWLSREGVMAIVTFAPLSCSAIASLFFDRSIALPGLLGSLLCLVTVFCTAMIHASLRSVDTWHSWLTPACYLAFSVAGGLTLSAFFASFGAGPSRALALCAIAALIVAWGLKQAWRYRAATTPATSTAESATGLGFIGRVRPFEPPHTGESYLTREFGFRIARKHAAKLTRISLIAGGAVPAVLLLAAALAGGEAGPLPAVLALAAALSHLLGVLTERWLFFAEARHAVMTYYGR